MIDVNVDDVGMARLTADHADGSGRRFIQRDHDQLRGGKQSGQLRLARTAAPGLGDRTGWNGHLAPVVQRPVDECSNSAIKPFDSHQSPGIEGEPGNLGRPHDSPSCCSAQA